MPTLESRGGGEIVLVGVLVELRKLGMGCNWYVLCCFLTCACVFSLVSSFSHQPVYCYLRYYEGLQVVQTTRHWGKKTWIRGNKMVYQQLLHLCYAKECQTLQSASPGRFQVNRCIITAYKKNVEIFACKRVLH